MKCDCDNCACEDCLCVGKDCLEVICACGCHSGNEEQETMDV